MIKDGQLKDQQEFVEYVDYTAEIGDLMQTHTVPSVMLYDNRFRQDQAESQAKWSVDNWHASLFHLEKCGSPLH